MSDLELFIVHIIWEASLQAGMRSGSKYNNLTNEVFYQAWGNLHSQIGDYLLNNNLLCEVDNMK